MKQALTETLAYFDENDQAFRMSDLRIYVAAARLVERLLPGVCENCDRMGGFWSGGEEMPQYSTCPVCHGSGRVWDEGIVEALAKVICRFPGPGHNFECRDLARAALSALVELLTEKVEPPKDPWDYDP